MNKTFDREALLKRGSVHTNFFEAPQVANANPVKETKMWLTTQMNMFNNA
jgi:hypothetical protein